MPVGHGGPGPIQIFGENKYKILLFKKNVKNYTLINFSGSQNVRFHFLIRSLSKIVNLEPPNFAPGATASTLHH